jgi:hypothetical protein
MKTIKKVPTVFAMILSCWVLLSMFSPSVAWAVPVVLVVEDVTNTREILSTLEPRIMSAEAQTIAILAGRKIFNENTKKDLDIKPLPLPLLAKATLPEKETDKRLLIPDVKVLPSQPSLAFADSFAKHYKWGVLPIPNLCPDGTKKMGGTNSVYGELQDKMCMRMASLKAYKISLIEDYKDKLSELQLAAGYIAVHSPKTTGENNVNLAGLHTVQAMEQALTSEFNANMDRINAKIVIADDLQEYAGQVLIGGAPTSAKAALATEGLKLLMQVGINEIVSKKAPYVK